MVIEIDDKILEQDNLSPDEYVYLFYLFNGALPRIELNVNYAKLIRAKFISDDEPYDTSLLDRAMFLFQDDAYEKKFEELWATFPQKVPSPQRAGEFRILRTVETSSHQAKQIKRKYRLLSKKHNTIMQGLKNQLATQDVRFINNIETWVNRRVWEKYLTTEPSQTESSGGKIL